MKLLNIETPVTRHFIPQILLNVQDFYFYKVGYTSYDEGISLSLSLSLSLSPRLTWKANQVGTKAAQRLGVRGPLLDSSAASIRISVLLYKQLSRMKYACPIWRSAAPSNDQRLQVLQQVSSHFD
jgi:hypothetical protein